MRHVGVVNAPGPLQEVATLELALPPLHSRSTSKHISTSPSFCRLHVGHALLNLLLNLKDKNHVHVYTGRQMYRVSKCIKYRFSTSHAK
jgi:hypothetical protein